jgi:uncharacterized protein (DUF58 family)
VSSVEPRPAFLAARVRFTAAGVSAVVLLLAAGIVAVNAGNNLLYLVVSGLLALLTLSGIVGHVNVRRILLGVRPPEEIYAGQPVSLALAVFNPRRYLPVFLFTIAGEGVQESIVEIPPGGTSQVAMIGLFAQRGHQPYPLWELTSEFPFGLIRRGGLFRPAGSCLVYPRPLPVPWAILENAEREGDLRSRQVAGADGDWRGLRDYAPGDSLSRVQWKSWLRLRRLQTKEFDAEGAAPVIFSWVGVPGPGLEERLGQLTWLVRTALRRGRAVGLELPGRSFAPGSGLPHRRALLTALAEFGEKT